MTPVQLENCRKITQNIWDMPVSEPFHEKVDPVREQAPNYYEKIRRPMELRTVLEKLDNGQYPTVEKWREDMLLIWKNAMTYNEAGNPIHEIAAELNVLFKRESENVPRTDIEAWVMRCKKVQKKMMDMTEMRPNPQMKTRLKLKMKVPSADLHHENEEDA